jgi:hypothetical protein
VHACQLPAQLRHAAAATHLQGLHDDEAAPAVGHGAHMEHLGDAQRVRGCNEGQREAERSRENSAVEAESCMHLGVTCDELQTKTSLTCTAARRRAVFNFKFYIAAYATVL